MIRNLNKIFAVFRKDILSELRSRYAFTSVLLFVLVAVSVVAFATASETPAPEVSAGILWIIMFFGSMAGLSKSFISEEERGTAMLLGLTTGSTCIFFGKLIYNCILSLVINFLSVALLLLFLASFEISLPGVFILLIVLSSVGMAGATTIISAIIAKANSKNALFPILSFPLLLPLIIVGTDTTIMAMAGETGYAGNIRIIVSYCVIVITASYLLFDFVWKD